MWKQESWGLSVSERGQTCKELGKNVLLFGVRAEILVEILVSFTEATFKPQLRESTVNSVCLENPLKSFLNALADLSFGQDDPYR